MRRIFVTLACLNLLGCAAQPVVSDVNDSAVKIQANSLTNPDDVLATANETCGIYGRRAIRLSYVCLDEYCIKRNYLFACKATEATTSQQLQTQQPAASQPLSPAPTVQPNAATNDLPATPDAAPTVEAFKACTLPNNQVVSRTESQCKAAGGKTHVS